MDRKVIGLNMKAQSLHSFLFIGQVPLKGFLSKRNVLFWILVNQHKQKKKVLICIGFLLWVFPP